MSEQSLLPCPFCGHRAEIRGEDRKAHFEGTGFYIVCLNEECGISMGDECCCPYDGKTGQFDSKKEAAEAWNKRAV